MRSVFLIISLSIAATIMLLTGCNEQKFQKYDFVDTSACPEEQAEVIRGYDSYRIQLPDARVTGFQVCVRPEAVRNLLPPSETHTRQIELLFVIDTTGSMSQEIAQVRNNLRTLADYLSTVAPTTKMGVAIFQDSPLEGGTSPYRWSRGDGTFSTYEGDTVYELKQALTSDMSKVEASLSSLVATGGGDLAETQAEALYQAATGEGLSHEISSDGGATRINHPDVAPSNTGWSSSDTNVARYVVVVSDAPSKELSFGHTKDQAIAALKAKGIMFIGMAGSHALPDMRVFASGTGVFAKSTILELNPGDPMAFRMSNDGKLTSDSPQAIADALNEAIRQSLPFQIEIRVNDPEHRIAGGQRELLMQSGSGDTVCANLNTNWRSARCGFKSDITISLFEKTNEVNLAADGYDLTKR